MQYQTRSGHVFRQAGLADELGGVRRRFPLMDFSAYDLAAVDVQNQVESVENIAYRAGQVRDIPAPHLIRPGGAVARRFGSPLGCVKRHPILRLTRHPDLGRSEHFMISAPSPAHTTYCKEICAEIGLFLSFFHASRPSIRPRRRIPGTRALRHAQQVPSGHEQIRQATGHEQAIGILGQSSITYLTESKDTFDDKKRMLDFRANLRFRPVLLLFRLAQWTVAGALSIGEITGLRRTFPNGFRLPTVGRIAPDTGFFPVQQVGQHLAVMDIGRRGSDRMNQFRLAVHADMRLHAEVPLVALLRRVHLRVPFLLPVLGRTRRADDGGIHNRAPVYLQAVFLQVFANQLKQLLAQVVGFQQVAELENRRLVRRRLFAKVDAGKAAHGAGVVQGFFHGRVGKVEPVLEEMDPKHALKANGPATGAFGLGIEGLDDGAKLFPRNNSVHFLKKDFPACGLAVAFKAAFGKAGLAHAWLSRRVDAVFDIMPKMAN